MRIAHRAAILRLGRVKNPFHESFPVPLNGLGDPVVLDHVNAYAEHGHGWVRS
jgi:hypothetical protein